MRACIPTTSRGAATCTRRYLAEVDSVGARLATDSGVLLRKGTEEVVGGDPGGAHLELCVGCGVASVCCCCGGECSSRVV